MTKIKICGLSRIEDIEVINQVKPDYIGFVFAKSKRQISKEKALFLKNALDQEIKTVGVFVNQDFEWIKSLSDAKIIDLIQLHGDENQAMINRLKAATHLPIIKAIRIKENQKPATYKSDYLLFDTEVKNHYGGTGKTFNWELVKVIKKSFFLAGGLNCNNIEEAIKQTKPYCVDISSGVESNHKKDPEKIKAIVAKIRGMNHEK